MADAERARDALADLVLAVDDLITLNKHLTTREEELIRKLEVAERQTKLSNDRADDFAKRMDDAQKDLTRKAQEAEQRASQWERRANEAESKALADMDELRRRLESAEQRATLYEQRADEHEQKADRTDALEAACEKLLTAMSRLPLRMEEAGLVQTVVKPEIPLYGTYEWQAVMDAKMSLINAMGKADAERT